jgi:phage-related minor tail protein
MTDSYDPTQIQGGWNDFVQQMNEEFVDALEQNMEAQAEFVESWSRTVQDATEDEQLSSGVEGYARAYEVWMEAAEQMVDRANEAVEGEEVELEQFRDVWLNSANEAFKEVMSTTAFAAATGETVEQALELQRRTDEAAETTLHALGFATEGDVQEVGERLVELERRQHEIENKLDRILDGIES